jgi:oligopeptide transport system ATP-binding protein
MTDILEVKNLEVQFKTREGIVHAVNGVSFNIKEGETLGIVGESGCGKSVTVMSLLKLISCPPGKIVAGKALYQGKDLLQMSEEELRILRGSEISVVFQDPMTSFNPVLTIGQQVAEPLEVHKKLEKLQITDAVKEIFNLVGIPNPLDRMTDYPHQFSGGMRQRAMIAMALTCKPKILIADEPTTALDVTIQAQIVELVKQLRDELGMSIIWITHDLGVIAGLAHRIMVMYGGCVIEEASVNELYANPQHPYTLGLLGSMPHLDAGDRKRLVSIEGTPPVLFDTPNFCPFAPRCKYQVEHCLCENPTLQLIGNDGHKVACWVDIINGRERK